MARASVLLLRDTGPGASMVFRSVSGHSDFAGVAEASLCDCVSMEQSICTDSGVYACGNNSVTTLHAASMSVGYTMS